MKKGFLCLAFLGLLPALCGAPPPLPKGHDYFELRDGLGNSQTKFEREKTGRVAFLGGSITYNGGWRDDLMRQLRERFPGTTFDFIPAGIPSVGSNGNAFRLERDVLARGPIDLLFVEAAVNDGTNIPLQPDLMLRGMEGVVRHIRRVNPMADVVLMHFVMPEAIAAYDAGTVPVAVAQHERVAVHYGCPSLNLTLEVTDRIKAGQFTWAEDFKDVHPPPFGQRLYAASMIRMLDAAFGGTPTPKPHTLPGKPLDPYSFGHGRFGALGEAKLGKGFTLDPAWKPSRPSGTREGFVNVPALTASEPGSEFTYDFPGSAIGLFLAAGPDTCVLEFSVDGAAFKRIDPYSPWSGGLYLPWPVMLEDTLKPGRHTVTIRTTDQAKDRTGLHIIQLLINPDGKR